MEISEVDITLYGYTEDGLFGVLTYWVEPDGSQVFVSDFSDGYAWVTYSADGTITTETTLAPGTLEARTAAMASGFTYSTHPLEAGWLGCALGITLTAAALAAANPWGLGAGIAAACACVPLLSKEFEDIECPGF
ncbi:hypothetical protein ENSA7_33640 [Enhygromyxa salina]|uniref:Uncharacterized protein n=2 Tax=Enhygromyxa salina TaxID=215803 RepID=A0A2S9YPC7_9BACT|nr:hypothetical protein ENSA7_33640 [Enhygromyxa salina]